MVGKRSLADDRKSDRKPENGQSNGDLESGSKHRYPKFKDSVELAMAERTTMLLKKQLRDGMTQYEFENYRKSDEEAR